MGCPFAYLLFGFMWVVRTGGKIMPFSMSSFKKIKLSKQQFQKPNLSLKIQLININKIMNEKSHATLLVNLGSPKELDKKSVREYLKIFLSDDYVVDIPKIIQ